MCDRLEVLGGVDLHVRIGGPSSPLVTLPPTLRSLTLGTDTRSDVSLLTVVVAGVCLGSAEFRSALAVLPLLPSLTDLCFESVVFRLPRPADDGPPAEQCATTLAHDHVRVLRFTAQLRARREG